MNNDKPSAGPGESTFQVYREGGTTPRIRLSINLVLVARRWRALLDDRLRAIGLDDVR